MESEHAESTQAEIAQLGSEAPRAIFWDMDGTLVDSEPLWAIATYEMSERLGRRITPAIRDRTVGGSFYNTVGLCAEHAGVELTQELVERERAVTFARMRELLAQELVPNPGIVELLTQLQAAGIPMLVTTNTERALADQSIAAVGTHFFVSSITGDEVASPKPAPDMYLAAAEYVGAQPNSCLVFEDSWAGMSAAVAAGCRVIGLAEHTPPGVCSIFDVHSENSFLGVDAQKVNEWFFQALR